MEGATGIVVGNCRLEEQIGQGGAGTVYRARQLGVNRPVAVKLIPLSAGLDTPDRFEREAQAAGALDHPHCLPVYAAGEQDGLLYLVMRLVNGPDLAQLIRREGPLAPHHAVALLEQVASAVDHAHRAGLVHRDLKPANILIEPDGGVGHAYVSDFGLMRSLADSPITLTGQWVGTPQFAAPEQQRGEAVGPAADIYALGRVLAQMVGPEPPRKLLPVLDRAMDPDPERRFPTAGALAAAASAAVADATTRRGSARRDAPGRRTTPGPELVRNVAAPSTVATRRQPVRRSTPSRGLRWAAALGLIAVIAAAAVVVVIALPSHRASPRNVTRPQGSTTTTAPPSGTPFVASAYTATLPNGWTTVLKDEKKQGYMHAEVQSANGAATVTIDDGPSPLQTPLGHAQSVARAAARITPGYQVISAPHTVGGVNTVIWTFAVNGTDKVDVFRQVDQEQFAVLAVSGSLSMSERVATRIAASIRLR